MRMGGHFLRLVLAVDKLVELLEVVPEHPPPEAAAVTPDDGPKEDPPPP